MKQRPFLKVDADVNGEVCITGNRTGLLWLARMCSALANNQEEGHLHLQNEGDVLDSNHLPCTLRCCDESDCERHGRQGAFFKVAVAVAVGALCAFAVVKYML